LDVDNIISDIVKTASDEVKQEREEIARHALKSRSVDRLVLHTLNTVGNLNETHWIGTNLIMYSM
jgi:hypothetical protein